MHPDRYWDIIFEMFYIFYSVILIFLLLQYCIEIVLEVVNFIEMTKIDFTFFWLMFDV